MGRTQRSLTEAEESELAGLNDAVTAAIAARKQWLDVKMHETSRLKVGDDIYNLETGRKLGVVSKLYRYWGDRDDGIRDTSIYCSYQYETAPRSFDNTSRQPGLWFGSYDDYVSHTEQKISWLRYQLDGPVGG